MNLGICVPAFCSVQDFNNFKPYFIETINLIIPEIFENIKGFDLNMQLTTSDLIFEDSYERNKQATKADAASWAIGIVLVLL